jgi:hypothetical protein
MWQTRFAVVLLAAVLGSVAADGQGRGGGRGRFLAPSAVATGDDLDGAWHFCRLAYSGRAWATDYPDADYNYSTRVSELTKTTVGRSPSGEVKPLIVRPTDDALFDCPIVMLWQAESLYFSDQEAARMRQYLLKGGFLWSDDSWGTFACRTSRARCARCCPTRSIASRI